MYRYIINPQNLTYVPAEYAHKRNDPRTRQILWQEHEVGQIVRQAERDLRAPRRPVVATNGRRVI